MQKLIHRFAVVALLGATVASAQDTAAPVMLPEAVTFSQVLDLTQPMYEGMPFWPGGVPFTMTRLVDYAEGGYRLHKFEVGENTGTHVDAPSHFIEGGTPIENIALNQLVTPAVMIDIQDKVAQDEDYLLSADDVRAWEAEHGEIPSGALVILNTGWYKRFGEPERYINMDAEGVMRFPGYGPDAAELLLERDVAGIGIDTLSLDNGSAETFATHDIMLGADKYQIENMANLDALPPTGATIVVGVLPVRDGSQAQARIFALLP